MEPSVTLLQEANQGALDAPQTKEADGVHRASVLEDGADMNDVSPDALKRIRQETHSCSQGKQKKAFLAGMATAKNLEEIRAAKANWEEHKKMQVLTPTVSKALKTPQEKSSPQDTAFATEVHLFCVLKVACVF